jgi:Ser-tRNA(Ala) deacylase AlaX
MKQHIIKYLSINLVKYQTIKEYCIQYNYDSKFRIFKNKIDFSEIEENKNLIQIDSNLIINVLLYFDWFPHIAHFQFHNNLFNYIIYNILKENAKTNSRNWNIFEDQKKIELDFKEFLIMLAQKHSNIKNKFIIKNEFQKYYCQDCNDKNNLIKIKNKYFCCRDYLYWGDKKYQCLNMLR